MHIKLILSCLVFSQVLLAVVGQIGFLDYRPVKGAPQPQHFKLTEQNHVQPQSRSSSSLCSKHQPSGAFRYHNRTKECYQVPSVGPCANGMIFYNEDDVYGECDCDLRSERPLIYHPNSQKCYPIFSQGYCPERQWLLLSEDFQPYCKSNPCYGRKTENENGELVPFRGTCAELGARSRYCAEDEILTFVSDEIEPTCGFPKDPIVIPFTLSNTKFRCAPGSARSLTGKCRPVKKLKLT